ncbi:MAG: nucleotide-diphospho-sugar transferase [Bacteroidota bacterium]|nr:nucleotide-diphospho-sugar transferase [Bacteroidota bacterium]
MFTTPVLLIIFNRPVQTAKVLEALAQIKPAVLYVAADGPRADRQTDAELCAKTRKLIDEMVTWDCKIERLFRDKNLGCGKAVSESITWFFDHNESGIILEDDCIPDPSFFPFCAELLNKYKDKEEVMHIGGTNFQQGNVRGEGSYYFSSEVHVWGWASWSRAWKKYDYDMKALSQFEKEKKILPYYKDKISVNFWLKIFNRMRLHEIDTWDYQWRFSIWNSGGLTIIPQKNLVTNIGFGTDATHTFEGGAYENMKSYSIAFPLQHSSFVTRNEEADYFTFDQHYKPEIEHTPLVKKVISKLKRLLR